MEKGSLVWMPDTRQGWIKGIVIKASGTSDDSDVTAKREDGEGSPQNFKVKDLHLVEASSADSLLETDDLTRLAALHEPALLEALQTRYKNDKIYTYTSRTILLAVNPFQRVKSLYSDETMKRYMTASAEDQTKLPPHAFAIAHGAYVAMAEKGQNQAVLVSGESGAGKTETTKIVMRYLAAVSRKGSNGGKEADSISERVLQCNPLLEAFGNAKTVRNDNSSRFGKLIHLHFDKTRLSLQGATITTYLLEKARLPQQNEGERNYHIFYEMVAGGSREQKRAWKLPDNIEDAWYCSQSGTTTRNDVSDSEQFSKTLEAMRILELSDDEINRALKLTAGILHLGDVSFVSSGVEGSSVDPSTMESLKNVCELLELKDPKAFAHVLTTRTVSTRGETFEKPLTEVQAVEARDSLASALYERLFGWIVWKINISLGQSILSKNKLSQDDEDTIKKRLSGKFPDKVPLRYDHKICCLDVFGFEVFETNSFEQLCINYCNEQLQSQFNEHVFTLEQKEYEKEGVDWKFVEFPDNQATIDMIETKPIGLLSLIDEECLYPAGTDKSMAAKLYDNLPRRFDRFDATNNQKRDFKFVVKHFAGDVEYTIFGFYKKNKNELRQDTVDLIRGSGCSLTQILFPPDAESAAGGADMASYFESLAKNASTKKHAGGAIDRRTSGEMKFAQLQQATVSSHFKLQLAMAMFVIRASTPHYVRCLKPNDQNVPAVFTRNRMLSQLRYSGVVEVIRVARAGYPTRFDHAEFVSRFAVLGFSSDGKKASASQSAQKLIRSGDSRALKEFCEKVMKGAKLEYGKDYQVGRNKVFLRQETYSKLEIAKIYKIRAYVVRIQRAARRYIAWKRAHPKPVAPPEPIFQEKVYSPPEEEQHEEEEEQVYEEEEVIEEPPPPRRRRQQSVSEAFALQLKKREADLEKLKQLPLPYLFVGSVIGIVVLQQLFLGYYLILGVAVVVAGMSAGNLLAVQNGDVLKFRRKSGRMGAVAEEDEDGLGFGEIDDDDDAIRQKSLAKRKAPVAGVKHKPPLAPTAVKKPTSSTSARPVSVQVNSDAIKRFAGLKLKTAESMENAKQRALQMRKEGKLKAAMAEYSKNPTSAKAREVFAPVSTASSAPSTIRSPKSPPSLSISVPSLPFKDPPKSVTVHKISPPPSPTNSSSSASKESPMISLASASSTPVAISPNPSPHSSIQRTPSFTAPPVANTNDNSKNNNNEAAPPPLPPGKPVLTNSPVPKPATSSSPIIGSSSPTAARTGPVSQSHQQSTINVKDEVKDEQEQDMIYRAILTMFFEEHAPTRIGDVDILLKKHKGREDKLLDDLTRHFTGVDPTKSVVHTPPKPPPRPGVTRSNSSGPGKEKKRMTIGSGGFFSSPVNMGAGLSASFGNAFGLDDSKTSKGGKQEKPTFFSTIFRKSSQSEKL